ncbi:MAG: pyrroline-5-carboxylate reductase [Candidatus Diapherotrites archaeon]|uniref:Pyrroline-5-carboxylate reductase n=1 Tax=Candidatus Iainarchaeum sp. TaxID=3101447 RepID=A0A2D6M1V1_9ARCH|nr:pyrroline-5-carboxylate reductase [Candidatus Diapherotrites archaeon]|tara:strand:- start:1363 stop:2151 length:789 start_codon:yes stop_codon:yes gene_type:complete
MIGFIGCGKMASAIIASMLDGSRLSPKEIIAFDVNQTVLQTVKEKFRIGIAENNVELVGKSEVIFLAVKPQDMAKVFREIRDVVSREKLFISIAAGVSLEELTRGLPAMGIVRVIPNIACLVGETMACYTAAESASEKDKKFVETVFSRAGKVLEVEEKKMHAITALSGSGPGFIAFFLDELSKAAVKNGLSQEEADLLAKQTFIGTAKLLSEKDIHPSTLVSMVASKGGTTEAGLKAFEQNGFSEIVEAAIKAAVRRSKVM